MSMQEWAFIVSMVVVGMVSFYLGMLLGHIRGLEDSKRIAHQILAEAEKDRGGAAKGRRHA